jgi:hypothetical protein
MSYVLWAMTSRTVLAEFGTEVEALGWVRDQFDDAPPTRLADLALMYDRGDAHVRLIADGEGLWQSAALCIVGCGADPRCTEEHRDAIERNRAAPNDPQARLRRQWRA